MTLRARLFATLIAVVSVAGLVLQFVTYGIDHPGADALDTVWSLARFFTILTNALVAAVRQAGGVTLAVDPSFRRQVSQWVIQRATLSSLS